MTAVANSSWAQNIPSVGGLQLVYLPRLISFPSLAWRATRRPPAPLLSSPSHLSKQDAHVGVPPMSPASSIPALPHPRQVVVSTHSRPPLPSPPVPTHTPALCLFLVRQRWGGAPHMEILNHCHCVSVWMSAWKKRRRRKVCVCLCIGSRGKEHIPTKGPINSKNMPM